MSRGRGGAIEGAPLPFGHGGERGLHELEPLDLPAACRSPAMTGSAVERRRVDAGNVTLPWIEWGRRPGDV